MLGGQKKGDATGLLSGPCGNVSCRLLAGQILRPVVSPRRTTDGARYALHSYFVVQRLSISRPPRASNPRLAGSGVFDNAAGYGNMVLPEQEVVVVDTTVTIKVALASPQRVAGDDVVHEKCVA